MLRRDLSAEEMQAFEPDNKVGILATLDEGDLPHLSLITTLRAKGPRQLMWGQFCEGASKANVERRPKTAFCVMTLDRRIWRGRARWTDKQGHGEDYERFNQAPMFRYNAYFGIHTAHHMELESLTGPESINLAGLGAGLLLSAAIKRFTPSASGEAVMNSWTRRFLSRPDTLTFLSWVEADGYPTILPLVPTTAVDSRRLLIAPWVYRAEFQRLEAGKALCVFGLNLAMESVCVRGIFRGFSKKRFGCGLLDLDWAYNSMPPKQGRIYPPQALEAIQEF